MTAHPRMRPKVCVVGDLLADTDIDGAASRLSPEAPVPVVDEQHVTRRPGGAGLAAVLASRAGGEVSLVSAVADDGPADRLRELLSDDGVHLVALPWDGATVEKIRIRASNVPMLRLDRGGGVVGDLDESSMMSALNHAMSDADVVVVCDYGRGVVNERVVRDAITAARRTGVPVVWDPHRRGPAPIPGATLVCPNEQEAAAFEPDVLDPRVLGAIVERGRRLRSRWAAGAVSITLGEHGAVVVLGSGAPLSVPVLGPSSQGDTCGAGDAFAAAAAMALATGSVVSEAVQDAVRGAAEFVAAGGAGALAVSQVIDLRDEHHHVADAGSGTLVATGGCFDILHPGHVQTLRAARRLGDRLVVLLNDDESVRRLKGWDRPLQPVGDRKAVLESLTDVDDVVVFSDDTPVNALRRLRPDVFVKGGDYTAADIPETEVLAEWGGSVVTVPFLDGRSTTSLVSRARTHHDTHHDKEPSDAHLG